MDVDVSHVTVSAEPFPTKFPEKKILRGRGRRAKKPAVVKKPPNPNPRAKKSTKKSPEDPDIMLAARGRLRQRATKPKLSVEEFSTSPQEQTSNQINKTPSTSNASQKVTNSQTNSQKRKRSNSRVMLSGKKKPSADTPGLVHAVTSIASSKDDALHILSVYLKSIKPLSEDEMLRERREKLEKEESDLAKGKAALQTLGLEIQVNYKKLTASKKAAKNSAQKREIDKDIEKVTVGSRALIQIGQKLEIQKEKLFVERKLLEEDEKSFRNSTKCSAAFSSQI